MPEFKELVRLGQCETADALNNANPEYIKMPFRKVWLDGYYRDEGTVTDISTKTYEDGWQTKFAFCDKWGVLATELGSVKEKKIISTISVLTYLHYKLENKWLLSPIWHVIAVGEKITYKRTWLDIYGFNNVEARIDILESEGSADGLYAAIAFLKLINCKNISTEIVKAPEALNKKRKRNGKQEIFDYHVLVVNTPSSKQEYKTNAPPLSHNRLHLCRGHFKEYTSEHPLFGKLTGLYWWQPYVRGKNKEGIVMKEYIIKGGMNREKHENCAKY